MSATTPAEHAPPGKTPPWDPAPHRGEHADLLRVQVGATEVARYVDGAGSPAFDSPRPHLHPVRTRTGIIVTDASPADHTWHAGLGVAVQDVDGANLWGGRTYLPGPGYTWRHDHGHIEHREWLRRAPGGVRHRLAWTGPTGEVLLDEVRELHWALLDDESWRLEVSFTLTLPAARTTPVELGSPGSHGRPLAGYGGMLWRLPPCDDVDLRTPSACGEDAVHGSRPDDGARWLAWSARARPAGPNGQGGEFTVMVAPVDEATAADPWFVRVRSYPAIGSALAWSAPVEVSHGRPLRRAFTFVVADGRWPDDRVTGAMTSTRPGATWPTPPSAA
ncbi:PmoA family protein [Cellulomonas sp. KRMCY2]|uniref:DUF6807 domain-containing protein n=1 Tax=Cellulomonas sp. KRMCY2 TaxID=1304865 RepID=UPI0018CC150F|nr:PmoA family protein [Cellulomonas sp. KRMCY2]